MLNRTCSLALTTVFWMAGCGPGPAGSPQSSPAPAPAWPAGPPGQTAGHASSTGMPVPVSPPGETPGEPPGEPIDPYDQPAQPAPAPPSEPAPPPAPAKPPPAPAGPGGWKGEILSAHNALRARHCAPPMTWSNKIAQAAQRWADALKQNQCGFEHDPNTQYGENLAYFAPVGSAGAPDVAAGWYSEVSQYNFSKPGFAFNTGHFTQVVWVRSTELGCGVARCGGGEVWVCRYNPPGNMMRAFRRNVLPQSCRAN